MSQWAVETPYQMITIDGYHERLLWCCDHLGRDPWAWGFSRAYGVGVTPGHLIVSWRFIDRENWMAFVMAWS